MRQVNTSRNVSTTPYRYNPRKKYRDPSKFDKDRERIEELLRLGMSVHKIARVMEYSNHIGMNTYIKKWSIRESLEKE